MRRIVIVGGGYAGVLAAARLARKSNGRAHITLITARPTFVERIRLHRTATGRPPRPIPIERFVRGTGVELEIGWVSDVDLSARRLRVEGAVETETAFDDLVIATGSESHSPFDEALPIADEPHARAFATKLAHDAVRRVTVVGGGLTGIEVATELARTHRHLQVTSIASSELGAFLSTEGRAHVRARFDELGIEVIEKARVAAVERTHTRLEDGRSVASDLVAWCGGFTASPLAARAGLAVDEIGRARVDDHLRSLSHAFVRVVGDAARVEAVDPKGERRALRMACATALPMGAFVADDLAAEVASKDHGAFDFAYTIQCIALGRGDGLVDRVDAWDRAIAPLARRRAGAALKELVCRYTVGSLRGARLGIDYSWPKSPKAAARVAASLGEIAHGP